MSNVHTLSTVYHGFADPALPWSLVVRHGTVGNTRDRTEQALMGAKLGPFATKADAVLSLSQTQEIPDALKPFVGKIRFHEERQHAPV